MIKTALIL